MNRNLYSRNFGCKFEFSTDFSEMEVISSEVITEIYGENKLKAIQKWYKSNNNYDRWHLKLDSSTMSELCTPISTLSDLKSIMEVLKKIGNFKKVKVTQKDSFHVHMDVGRKETHGTKCTH